MNDSFTFFQKLFNNAQLPIRWHNGNWNDFDGWIYFVSDMLLWSSYFLLPVIILVFVMRKNYSRFHKLYLLSAVFIFFSGLVFLLDTIAFWYPMYRLSAFIRLLAGTMTWITILSIIKVLPVVVKFRSAKELTLEVEKYKTTEEEFRKKNQHLNEAQELAKMGHFEWDVVSNSLRWSYGLYVIYGLKPEDKITFDKFISLVHPDDRIMVNSIINSSFNDKMFQDYYHRIKIGTGEVKTILARGGVILDNNGNVLRMIGTGQDVTKEKKTEEELLQKTRKLELMNNELQKFAYITSHDLQEPLRKILTFSSRLMNELHQVEKNKSIQYIEKIIYSTTRMQKLIEDVLQFSSLSGENKFSKTDLNQIIAQVIGDMEVAIENKGAIIEYSQLPSIDANVTQMGQLFQNMLSNAIKFQIPDIAPKIIIDSKIMQGNKLPDNIYAKLIEQYAGAMINEINYTDYCCISFTDNGIGFDLRYFDKIFEVFQRLNNDSNFDGTGIGLAICKKIIENHQGVITAKSKHGNGTTFTITLPRHQ